MGIRKRFTILHSNDMHGDFLAEMRGEEGHLIGGLSLLSGYINEVRSEEKNVIYCIAGDMVQGSLIDAEYKGISTMEIMNYLSPDVASLGNHEFDYGLPHLLFLEKMANFPIVNANLYITQYNKRLFQPYVVKNVDGFDILFIGIITEKVMDMLKTDNMLSSFITLQEAASEVGKICNAYKTDDIDLTILLTHIGFESDKELASLLDPAWGVDMIIGGHSHTILEQPAIVKSILIAQAGVGTDQVGRFDITVDDDTNSIVDWTWKLVPINNVHCQPDEKLTAFIDGFKDVVDKKYGSIISKFTRKLTHPDRTRETELGNLFADAIQEKTGVDVAFVGSGSIRQTELGPVVTLGDYLALFPYDDSITRFTVTGAQLRHSFAGFMRPENRNGEGEYYQVNKGVKAVYDLVKHELVSLTLNGVPVTDSSRYSICLQGYHFKNSTVGLQLTNEELAQLEQPRLLATSGRDVVEEYLRNHQNVSAQVEGRLQYI
ncbi:bifunctional metallophosphatase/5'-nucleotidase [Candidatus Cryosericum hinesii]|uniref:Bifunctional metallophosphatase/5'-nucleotidase n=1 Tax=Candidatus Cryosericum hinesii TaxID=2290915 RepID=A0ABX9MBZ8_9BACT|nr:bifunctional UDP-sugar hydrolase/5'-nucleotidase [Candidatus Cryosericum hinesii]RIE11534.1 bifunctional metallophosphatase/5'-nucleotidase [Candidatus Cryosericum hinesii]